MTTSNQALAQSIDYRSHSPRRINNSFGRRLSILQLLCIWHEIPTGFRFNSRLECRSFPSSMQRRKHECEATRAATWRMTPYHQTRSEFGARSTIIRLIRMRMLAARPRSPSVDGRSVGRRGAGS